MLFVLHDSLIDSLTQADADRELRVNIIEALTKIASSYRRGNHLIFAPRNSLKVLKQCEALAETTRNIYNSLLNHYAQLGPLRDFGLKVEVRAQIDKIKTESINDQKILCISAAHVANTSMTEETILLAESQNDVRFYKRLAEVSIHQKRNIIIKCDPRGGGGSTIVSEFQSIVDRQNRLCLCIVDSDRKYPQASMSETAKQLMKKYKYENLAPPLCHCEVLKPHEVENLIPTRYLDEAIKSDPNRLNNVTFLEALESSDDREARSYLDLKDGLKLGPIIQNESAYTAYWKSIVFCLQAHTHQVSPTCWTKPHCTDKEKCNCLIISGFGDKILDEVLAHPNFHHTGSSHKVYEALKEPLKTEWANLGQIIEAWCCGGNLHSAI